MDSGCWYCGKPALEVWHTTWDVDGQEWPMCEECAGAVRIRLDLRARGLTSEADLGDERHGIDTRGIAGKWIVPEQEKADMIKPYWTSACGRFVIYCGDCLEVLPTLGKVDAVVTDPPYGIKKAEWDTEFPTAWYSYAREIATTVYTMPGNSALPICFKMVGNDYQDTIALWLSNGMTFGNLGFGNWIPVVVSQRERIYLGGQNAFRVVVETIENIDHPCPKPIRAMTQLLSQHGGDLILDPFMGSGTTGVACARLGRKFIGIEISQEYCDIAVVRIKRELSQPRLALEEQPTFEQASMFENDSET